jgi:3'-phosphoadenosine 5'-phosphosulfate sulfotransferase (PAPS reductase)/FAD synthetase
MHLLDNDSAKDRSLWADARDGFSTRQISTDAPSDAPAMDHLDALEAQSIYILREAFARLKKLALLWSLGKDSNVMIWLARKAFFGRVPFPAMHVDTGKKFPEMYAFRDRYGKEWELDLRIEPCPPLETIDPTLPPAARSAARQTDGLKLALAKYADIWAYTKRENIPIIPLYLAKDGKRYRSLGDADITNPVASNAASIEEILIELDGTKVPERAGRALDHETEDAFERLRVAGYL